MITRGRTLRPEGLRRFLHTPLQGHQRFRFGEDTAWCTSALRWAIERKGRGALSWAQGDLTCPPVGGCSGLDEDPQGGVRRGRLPGRQGQTLLSCDALAGLVPWGRRAVIGGAGKQFFVLPSSPPCRLPP